MPCLEDIRRSWQRGKDMSTVTWTPHLCTICIFVYVTNSFTEILSHPLFWKSIGMSCTCTHSETLSKLSSLMGVSFSYHWSTTNCLSKLHGSLDKIFSTSSLLSKMNRIIWSPADRTLKPFLNCHNGLKVQNQNWLKRQSISRLVEKYIYI